jgi:hypothetical protein
MVHESGMGDWEPMRDAVDQDVMAYIDEWDTDDDNDDDVKSGKGEDEGGKESTKERRMCRGKI